MSSRKNACGRFRGSSAASPRGLRSKWPNFYHSMRIRLIIRRLMCHRLPQVSPRASPPTRPAQIDALSYRSRCGLYPAGLCFLSASCRRFSRWPLSPFRSVVFPQSKCATGTRGADRRCFASAKVGRVVLKEDPALVRSQRCRLEIFSTSSLPKSAAILDCRVRLLREAAAMFPSTTFVTPSITRSPVFTSRLLDGLLRNPESEGNMDYANLANKISKLHVISSVL